MVVWSSPRYFKTLWWNRHSTSSSSSLSTSRLSSSSSSFLDTLCWKLTKKNHQAKSNNCGAWFSFFTHINKQLQLWHSMVLMPKKYNFFGCFVCVVSLENEEYFLIFNVVNRFAVRCSEISIVVVVAVTVAIFIYRTSGIENIHHWHNVNQTCARSKCRVGWYGVEERKGGALARWRVKLYARNYVPMFLNFFSTVRFARTFHPHPHPVCTRLRMSAIHNCPPQPNHHLRDYHTNCYAHIGLFTTDRDEQMSSLSRTGSGYSPSFFFKPIKYGVMGNTLASNTNTVNNTTIKHQAVASLGNGKLANLPLFSLFSTPFWLLAC